MSYAHTNGIRYGVQYHPEHYYGDEVSYEDLWFDNFLNIARMHYDYRVNNASHPMEYFSFVKNRLDECMVGQIEIDISGLEG